jgi:hypothetical protein
MATAAITLTVPSHVIIVTAAIAIITVVVTLSSLSLSQLLRGLDKSLALSA